MRDEESRWRDNIDMILNCNTTVTTILNRVLDLAKWELGEFPIDATMFPILRLFKAIAAYAQANDATVVGLDSLEPTWQVEADEHLLKQAATNLISNASKFSKGLPLRVCLEFKQMGHAKAEMVVTVTDKGRGMTPDHLAKLMVETGHKGSLTLASEGLGKGTTARMCVP